jgi:CheY-like chemotaxis protein
VIDSGVGIAAENLPKVFQEIVQFDVNKNQKGGGSGMGLWLSKQIVELHGGSVAVSSEGLGKGCCFEVKLRGVRSVRDAYTNPAAIVPVNHLQSVRQLEDISRIQTGSVRIERAFGTRSSTTLPRAKPSVHCLVVDDSKMNRKVMVRLLQLLGHSTEEAEDGMQCVTCIQQRPVQTFALVCIDDSMPLLSGPAAATQLRERGYRGIILGVTGNAAPEDVRHFLESGADEVLIKPVSYEMLEQCLLRFVLTHETTEEAKVVG